MKGSRRGHGLRVCLWGIGDIVESKITFWDRGYLNGSIVEAYAYMPMGIHKGRTFPWEEI